MLNVFEYAKNNNVEVTVRKGQRSGIAWELYLKDRAKNLTEYSQIKDLELRGHNATEAENYIKKKMDGMMERIRREREEGAA